MRNIKDILSEFRENPGFFILCLTVFLLPFPRTWSLYSQGVFFFFGSILWLKDYSNLRLRFKSDLLKVAPLIAYFFLIVIWSLRSSGFADFIVPYLMFLLIPVLGYPVFSSEYFQKNINLFIKSFIFGILAICFFEFARATFNSTSLSGGKFVFNPDIDFNTSSISFDYLSAKSRFRSVQLSFLEHPPYLALKIMFALALIVEFRRELNFTRIINVSIAGALLIFLFCLSVRIGFLIPAIAGMYYLYLFFKKLRKRLVFILMIPIFLIGTVSVALLNTRVREKTELIISNLKSEKDLQYADPRLASWITSLELIVKHPVFGVGPDARNILAAEYKKKGLNEEAELRLNSHNQFLETQLTFGILGTLILIWMIFVLVRQIGISSKPSLAILFLIISCTSFLFESILVRQWGIMFFVMFYCFVMFLPVKPQKIV